MQIKKFLLALCILVMVPAVVGAENKYYLGEKIRGYKQAEFALLTGDDVNFRKAPFNGQVIDCLPHHTLMRILERQGEWLKVEIGGTEGYVAAAYAGNGCKDELVPDDFTGSLANLGNEFDADKAANALGKPVRKYRDKETKRDMYDYGKFVIGVRRHKVESIAIKDPQFITMRGVSIGDSNGRAVGQYGMPDGIVYADDCIEYEYRLGGEAASRFVIGVDKNNLVKMFVMELLDD